MIYSYRYLPHRIQGFHDNITFFFEELFRTQQTDVEQLVRPAFWPLVAGSSRLLQPMQQLAAIYVDILTVSEQQRVQEAFQNNNAIEDLCGCNRQPFAYGQLANSIEKPLKDFFISLWEDYPFIKPIEEKFGSVKEHFSAFVHIAHQQALICPFCGIHPLQPSDGKYRDAYDHFVPKALYPFSSVNFYNLVPTCNECNSNEKKAIDVPYRPDRTPRYMLYPFQTHIPLQPVEIQITAQRTYDMSELSTSLRMNPLQITLTRPDNPAEDFTGWDEVYHVKRRYEERVRQFEGEWWERFKEYYQDRQGMPFEEIKQSWLNLYRRVITRQMGVIEISYYRFLFNHPNLENLLRQTVR